MRLRTAAAACALAALTLPPMAGTAWSQPDLDCADFESREAAQRVLDGQDGDPYGLDADDDGRACEALPSEGGDRGEIGDALTPEDRDGGAGTPGGSVDAGGGGTAPGDIAPALSVAAALGLAAGGAVLVRRRRTAAGSVDRGA
ncbi:excalibur calcium-binding protein [Streptomyces sp. TRM 70361]|uniref:excalibur calcium-binding protein n=1 Tax=Streptomyces sp. TRM 70361 TaxID=3116553 RepID=UPI002E7AD6ED|nr:excalibur calcium-binding protein [Streptomyces sp. TRM 70361]MEE1941990.1 excalibur calcium-binding protein [Streptomyces sp. TRM 70361]